MEMKIALSRNINKNELYHQKTQSPGTTSKTHLVKGPDGKKIKFYLVAQHEHTKNMLPRDNQKMPVELSKNDERLITTLLIVGTGIMVLPYW